MENMMNDSTLQKQDEATSAASGLNAGLGRCSACNHWDKQDSEYYLGLGRCRAATEYWNATGWDDETGEKSFTQDGEKAKMFTQDGSDYRSILLTKSDFGCVEFVNTPNVKIEGLAAEKLGRSPGS